MSAAPARSLSASAARSSSHDDRHAPDPPHTAPTVPGRERAATRPTRGDEVPCRRADGDLWFADDPATVERAKAACAPCPLRQACLAGALERREPWGVWGGQLLVQGEVVARKRPRGRPRKDAVAA